MWEMFFDGASSKDGVGAVIWARSPDIVTTLHYFKLMFKCTNNVGEYETLMLGLNILKEKKTRKICVHGDSKLVINQVNGMYQTKSQRMRAYKNGVLEVLENFVEHNIVVIPRNQNSVVDSFDTVTSNFKISVEPRKKYEVEVRHGPSFPDNIDNWQVFEDDKHIERFMCMTEEFSHIN